MTHDHIITPLPLTHKVVHRVKPNNLQMWVMTPLTHNNDALSNTQYTPSLGDASIIGALTTWSITSANKQ